MFDLTGMTALVTGASGGLGKAIAQALSKQGARLALSGSNADRLASFCSELEGEPVALTCNLVAALGMASLPCHSQQPPTPPSEGSGAKK